MKHSHQLIKQENDPLLLELAKALSVSDSYNENNIPESIMSYGKICQHDSDYLCECRLQFIIDSINNIIKIKLTEYTDFLLKNGYTDTDVYAEPPTAIDRFLNHK